MEHIIPVLRDREDIPEDLKVPDPIIRIVPEDPAVDMADREITTDPEGMRDPVITTDPVDFQGQEVTTADRADIPDRIITTDPEDSRGPAITTDPAGFQGPAIMTDPADFQGKEATTTGRVDIKDQADRADFQDRADRVDIKDRADRADFPGRVVFPDRDRTAAADLVVPDRVDLLSRTMRIHTDPEAPVAQKDPQNQNQRIFLPK
jgi:hypothetical protein